MPDLDEELDRLYGLPLDQFTPARNDLARRLRAAGLGARADEVKALRKPPVSAWAVNQLARADAKDVAALVRAGERLAEAQGTAVAGDRRAFAEARDTHAELLRKLTARAAELLGESGRPATQPMRERIGESLRAASLDPDSRPALTSGRLEDDVEATGFSLLAGVELPRGSPRRPAQRDDRRAEAAELRRRLREARGRERDLRRRADKAARDAEAARAAAERSEERARAAELEAAQAAEAADELDRQLDELR